MVTMMKRRLLAPLGSALALVMSAMVALAQTTPTPNPVETTTRVTTTTWYGNWMVWAGVGVFLIVVIALTTRGSSRSS